MVKRGKPLGNKRQHEQAKARKKRDKEARRQSRKEGGPVDDLDPDAPDSEADPSIEPANEIDAPLPASDDQTGGEEEREADASME